MTGFSLWTGYVYKGIVKVSIKYIEMSPYISIKK